ncbi:MAG TPA: ABC transporter ATP-binding protein [Bauldia sp.]|nr:ABC transporter ATP-binding protein [Bauldia sp.]
MPAETVDRAEGAGGGQPLLDIRDLKVDFFTYGGVVHALNGVSLAVHRGEMLALVGESGSGKSVLAWTVLGLTKPPGRVVGGDILWRGESILGMSPERLNQVRGKEIGLIVSNPRSHLHPLTRVGRQIEAVRAAGSRGAREAVLEALRNVEMPDPMRVYKAYPHELSGGMAQRVLIAMALLNSPDLVVADDATSALDVTVQRQILDLMTELIQRRNTAALMITHDLGIVAQYCRRAVIVHAGMVLEAADTTQLFDNPLHPYTRGLLTTARRRRSDIRSGGALGAAAAAVAASRDADSYLAEVEPGHWVRVLRGSAPAGMSAPLPTEEAFR